MGIDVSVDRGYGMWHVVRDTALEENIKQTKREKKEFENKVSPNLGWENMVQATIPAQPKKNR